jgi:hypothetical protein
MIAILGWLFVLVVVTLCALLIGIIIDSYR